MRALAGAVAEHLAAPITETVASAMSTSRSPALLDRRGLSEALGVGVDTVDRLRREGCPELIVGEAPRFELDKVTAWLRDRRAK